MIPGVGIAIVNGLLVRPGSVLLVRRSAHRRAYPGTWSFPGGHSEKGETLDAALIREIGEELAVTPTIYEPLGTLADPDAPAVTYHLFRISAWRGGDPRLLGDEHSELRWFRPRDAMRLPDLALPSYRPLLGTLET